MTQPSYDLAKCQAIVAAKRHSAFTMTALNGIVGMSLTIDEALQVIASLTTNDLYKTMPSNQDPGMFQDVYHKVTPSGRVAYIKLTAYTNGRVVIQFKEK